MNQRAIYFFDCCTNGRKKTEQIPPHYFLILSNTSYNKKSKDYVTAIPISSKINSQTGNWNIAELKEDDIDLSTNINKNFTFKFEGSYVLCDRPCRIHKADLNKKKEIVAKISYTRYKEIVEQIAKFMKFT